MSTVSKLVIKACSDNKFSSFTGEFTTSINPENLMIKSGVAYHTQHQAMGSSSLLKYRGSPPKLLSFSLLFDNTGIMPGSNTIVVMEQIKQLQDIIYNVQKKNNAPNYIRVIWGQIDFKGRLVDLDIVYSMFQVDGTLLRAEAVISILEEISASRDGESTIGKDTEHTKASGKNASAILNRNRHTSDDETFKATPDGSEPYNYAPNGAYEGGPDDTYNGSRREASSPRNNGIEPTPGPVGEPQSSRNNGIRSGAREESSNKPVNNNSESRARGGPNSPENNGQRSGAGKRPSNQVNNSSEYGVGKESNKPSNNRSGSKAGTGANKSIKNNSRSGAGTGANKSIKNNSRSGWPKGELPDSGDLDSLKDTIKDGIPKLSFWQRAKLFAMKVAIKTYNTVKN